MDRNEQQQTGDRGDTDDGLAGFERIAERGVTGVIRQYPETASCELCQAALPGYLLGDWAPQDENWITDHLEQCAVCRQEWQRYRAVAQLLDRADRSDSGGINAPQQKRSPTMPRPAFYGRIPSSIGDLSVAVSDTGVCDIGFAWMESESALRERLRKRGFDPVPDPTRIAEATAELDAYFSGKLSHFSVPIDLSGLTPFSQAVLGATFNVPFGETRTYQQIAQEIGRPKATRAVGNALHRNPIPLIVPCHRILGTSAKFSLGGYAGGLETKKKLLRLEGVLQGRPALFS